MRPCFFLQSAGIPHLPWTASVFHQFFITYYLSLPVTLPIFYNNSNSNLPVPSLPFFVSIYITHKSPTHECCSAVTYVNKHGVWIPFLVLSYLVLALHYIDIIRSFFDVFFQYLRHSSRLIVLTTAGCNFEDWRSVFYTTTFGRCFLALGSINMLIKLPTWQDPFVWYHFPICSSTCSWYLPGTSWLKIWLS